MNTVVYKNYTVTKLDSGKIEATKDGQIALITKPLLRELAQELSVDIENVNGNLHPTRELGNLIMKAIKEKSSNNN